MRRGIYDEAVTRNPVLFPLAVAVLIAGPVIAAVTLNWWWWPSGWVAFFFLATIAGFVNIYRDAKAKR